MSDSELVVCEGCRWGFYPKPNDENPFCGPCSRDRGLEPRTFETDEVDRKFREVQAEENTERD